MNVTTLRVCYLCQMRLGPIVGKCQWKSKLHTSARAARFWEPYRSGEARFEPKEKTIKEKLKMTQEILKALPHEFKLLKDEAKERCFGEFPVIPPGGSDYVWKFNKPEVLSEFIVSSDKDHNDGYSECTLKINRNNKAVFSGTLSTQLPKDGKVVRTGYCSMMSKRPRKSFYRPSYFEWLPYTHLLMRVRGDGRSYFINLACEGDYDLTWHDMYNYILYTRGGPYWQFVKIPFSKFYMTSKGRIQDKQFEIPLQKITQFGIALIDKVSGPFHLEIDYVGLQLDPLHKEKFAYEMYEVPKYTAGV